jgi:hypothetical protein
MYETLLIKLAVILFGLSGLMCAITGSIQSYLFTKRFNSTIRTILYSGFIITASISILSNLSYHGIPLIVMAGIVFMIVGFFSTLINPKKVLSSK